MTLAESAYHQLLAKYCEIICPDYHVPEVKHATKHNTSIETIRGPPVASKHRRLAPDRFIAARKQFEIMLYMVPKDNGEGPPWRIIGR